MSTKSAGIVMFILLVVPASPQKAQQTAHHSKDHDSERQRAHANDGWPAYGGTLAGQRYSTASQINRENVKDLKVAWTFRTHALEGPVSTLNQRAPFEATPVLWNGTLYFDSPFDAIFALDATSGRLKWTYDPKVDRSKNIYIVTSRGVALWHAKNPKPGVCGADAVLVATLDQRLIARDAATGSACPKFGRTVPSTYPTALPSGN